MNAHQTTINGIQIGVVIRRPQPPTVSASERLVIWLGGPDKADRLARNVGYACTGFVGLYSLTWLAFLGGVVADRLHPTQGQSAALALAWAPVMGLQLLAFAVRGAVFSLTIKESMQIALATREGFYSSVLDHVNQAVTHALADLQQPPEKPTLQ